MNYEEDYYKGLAKHYFMDVLKKIVEFGNLTEEKGTILDYGCGHKHLKELIPGTKYVGYDVIKELSDVKDYKTIQPTKIVCSGVLEHLPEEEIKKLIADFKVMNPKHELLVFLPTENIVSQIGMILTGQKEAHDDHVTKYKKGNQILEEEYEIVQREYIWFNMAQITHYRLKDDND